MRLNIPTVFAECPQLNYGGGRWRLVTSPHRITFCLVIAATLWLSAIQPVAAQQGYDPRQTEKHFDDVQEQSRPARAPLHMPSFARPETADNGKPLFVFRGVSLVGATAIPHDQLAATYRAYLGRKVSQADLAGIAQGISERFNVVSGNDPCRFTC